MANLDVQRKKSNPLLWILLVLLAVVAMFFLIRGCDSTKDNANRADSTAGKATVAATQPDWNNVDFNLARSTDADITDPDIAVSGNEKYTIYSLGENILFASNENQLQETAEAKLQQVVNALGKRFKGATIGVYGSTDSVGDAAENKTLGADRAAAVKDWLINKGGLDASAISVHSLGENQPVATNATTNGRQQNRNVSIVAFAN